MDSAKSSQPACAQQALDLLNCVTESPYDEEKCRLLLQSLHQCVISQFHVSSHPGLSLGSRNSHVGDLYYCSKKFWKRMTKHQWKRSKKSFRSHLDPGVEEQLKWTKIEMESSVKRSLKLVKNMNSNREGNLKKKGEVIQVIQDIQKEYLSLCDSYNNLRDEVKKKIKGADEDSSSSTSSSADSDSYHTPEELTGKSNESGKESGKEIENSNQELDTSDSEKSVTKDILTSTSEVKKKLSLDSSSSTDEVPEIGEIVKDLKLQAEQSENRIEQLLDECAHLKDKLVEKDEEILSVKKNEQDFRKRKLDEISDLESQVKGLKLELETILVDKRDSEGQVECKPNENLSLQVRISELESLLGSKDEQLSSLVNQHEQENAMSSSKLDGLMEQVKNLELEVDSLSSQKCTLEEQLVNEKEKISAPVIEFTKQISYLEQELELVHTKKNQLELNLEEKSKEVEQCIGQTETLKQKPDSQYNAVTTEEKDDLLMKVKELEKEVMLLSDQKSELEDRILRTNTEVDHLKMQKDEVERKNVELVNEISVLKTQFRAKEDEMSSRVKALNVSIKSFQQEKKSLQLQLDTNKQESSEKLNHMTGKNIELTNKIDEQQKSLIEMEKVIKNLNEEIKQVRTRLADSTRSYHLAEKRIEEMAEEFFKKFEDNLRILSRRIKVSEQMHIENKDLYKKTKEKYEKYENQNKELKGNMTKNDVGLKNMKEMSLTTYEMLSSVDSDALRFEECTANFLNRMSKVSCELKFAKDWIMRKNKGMLHVKDELDCLLVQLDDKEAEILVFRERVWKSENKIRELEKMLKHREDGMLVLQEEKREAIRQLCVWIDYHRSRSDYYKKMLSDVTARYKRTP